MKKISKLIIEIIAISILLCLISIFAISSSAISDDPANNYRVQVAPNEDSSINMWFDYSFRKTFTSDKTSTGMNTFSIYMAKNEIESAQFVLYSNTDHTGMTATVSQFSDSKGNTVDAEIYYEMYVTTENLATTSILGSTESNTIIREGETPDPVVPLSKLTSFKLNAGKSQAFLIRAKTTSDSVSGWYSAQLDVKDSSGNIVKTATVYLYVWNFEISDKTELKTAFIMYNTTDYGGSYETFYNYFLENRLNAMDMPGGITSSTNSYLTNDRVAAARVSSNGLNNINLYMEGYSYSYLSIYNELATSPNWDEIKDKLYFYIVDEPLSKEQRDAMGDPNGATVDTVTYNGLTTRSLFKDAQTVVPFHENHPYPYYTYHKNLNQYYSYEIKDAFQEMLDRDAVTIWCPQLYAFTPQSELTAYNYTGTWNNQIHSLSATISGLYSVGSEGNWTYGANYKNWEKIYGEPYDRIMSKIALKKKQGETFQMWAYNAGWDFGYTYCNHLIENSGLQTKLLFWQLYQNDITGYLYYGTNNWTEYGAAADNTVTGAKTTCQWRTNKFTYPSNTGGNSLYGNGVLFYGKIMAKVNVPVVGSLRVEILRDGVEEYQMMSMLAKMKGNDVAKSYVNSISNNVVDYLSLPKYNRSAWSSSLDEYDIMESVRRSLGNAVEAATVEGECEHEFDDGVMAKEAGCLTVGTMAYTCTKCGTIKTEVIPTKHAEGSCYRIVQKTARKCTESSTITEKCSNCGYIRVRTLLPAHEDESTYVYDSSKDSGHKAYCSICNAEIQLAAHILFYTKVESTCVAEGYIAYECKCGYQKDKTVLPIGEHNYVKNVCTTCGDLKYTVVYGDVDSNGKVNAVDANRIARYTSGAIQLEEDQMIAGDVSGDGKINAVDVNMVSKYVSGLITVFDIENK